jgi:hypothetical protein
MKSDKVTRDKVSKAAKQGAKWLVRYGPQAKIVWDRGGRQAASAAAKRAKTLNARRKAFAHAAGLVNGTVLKIGATGTTAYVVFSGDRPVATYPSQDLPYTVLLEHADLTKRISAGSKQPRLRRRPRGKSVASVDD